MHFQCLEQKGQFVVPAYLFDLNTSLLCDGHCYKQALKAITSVNLVVSCSDGQVFPPGVSLLVEKKRVKWSEVEDNS